MEQAQFERLYMTYSADVYRLALSYLHSPQDAEDICHNIFLNLLNRNVQVLPQTEKTFLLTCTANACKDLLRSFWRTRVQPLDDTLSYSTENHRLLWDNIGKLPPKYRAVIHLYYYERYSQEQIAEILKISRTAVQTRMARARKLLKKELKQDV